MRTINRLFYCTCLFLFFHTTSHAQTVMVYLKEKEAFRKIPVTKGVINLDALPDTMTLVFPDEDPQQFAIQFNEDNSKDRFTVSINCKDSCEKILLSDIRDKKLHLIFRDSLLTGIGSRSFAPRKVKLDKNKKPVLIKILGVVEEVKKTAIDPYDLLKAPKDTEQKVMPVTKEDIAEEEICKEPLPNACDERPKSETKDGCCKIKYPSPFNQVFLKPCDRDGSLFSRTNAVTPKYRILVDTRPGAIHPVSYLKYKNKKDYEYYKVKKRINPLAKREIVFSVLGDRDSVFVVDSSTVQYFMELEGNFAKTFTQNEPAETTGSGSTTLPKDEKKNEPPNEGVSLQDTLPATFFNDYRKALALVDKLTIVDRFSRELSFSGVQLIAIRTQTNARLRETFIQLLDQYVNNLEELNELRKTNDSLKNKVRELTVKLKALAEDLGKIPGTVNLKEKLLTFEVALEKLNADYVTIDLREEQYATRLLCLKLFIKKELGIAVPDSPAEFAKLLINLASSTISKTYFTDFSNLIKAIETEYGKAVSKKAKYQLFSRQVQVPNRDEVTYGIKTKNGVEVFRRSFDVSGGFKIDFSTGIILHGINNKEYVLGAHHFRYRQTREFTSVGGQDSIVFTGNNVDTTGNLIHINRKKLSYSTGIIVHAYPRTGTFLNLGLTSGVVIDNNAGLVVLLGGSVLFNVGKSRLALTGGVAFGKEKALYSDVERHQWNSITDPDNRLYNSRNGLPQFFPGTNINTYEKRTYSLFFGLTYNFASINIPN